MAQIQNQEPGSVIRTKLNATGLRKNNFSALINPSLSNNFAEGYENGSLWLVSSTKDFFICTGDGAWSVVNLTNSFTVGSQEF